jgi:hypothetical protein
MRLSQVIIQQNYSIKQQNLFINNYLNVKRAITTILGKLEVNNILKLSKHFLKNVKNFDKLFKIIL